MDYALSGIHLKYRIGNHMAIKAFTGRQRDNDDRFSTSPQVIKGINIEEGFNIGSARINLGASGVSRTLDENTISLLVAEINGYPLEERFEPKYNVYAMNGYFDVTWKGFGIMAEYNYKTQEAIRLGKRRFWAQKWKRFLYRNLIFKTKAW